MTVLAASARVNVAAAQGTILFRLHTQASGDRLLADTSGAIAAFGKPVNFGATCPVLATGMGTRFMWIPCKSALRVGTLESIFGNNWNAEYIGDNSIALGPNTMATGQNGVAIGNGSQANGWSTAAVGSNVRMTGNFSAGLGTGVECQTVECTVVGHNIISTAAGTLALGYSASVSGQNSMALGHHLNTNNHLGAIALGDGGDAVRMENQFDNEFRVRARGGIRLRTSVAASAAVGVDGNTGCDLPAGSGSWTCASSRYVKENFSAVDGEDVLAKLSAMPVTTWNYIAEDKAVRHMGPVAQDFYSAFALGTDSSSIGMIDINGVNLAAVKALEQRTADLKAAQDQLTDKAKRIDALEERVARLEKALARRSR
jgi:hypothetical protein